MLASSSAFGSTRSSELASSMGQEVGSVAVVVTIALGLLLSSGAAAS
jgi:hypothetical protein